MKAEVRCPGCGSGWLVEHSAIGVMICPSCSTRVTVGETERRAEPARPVASVPLSSVQDTDHGQEVVCPRCKLHFFPRGRRAKVENGSRRTVLVVDDMEYFRQIATDALSPGFEVKTAGTADEARAILSSGGVDLVVLDLTLGDPGEGRRLLAELQPKPCPILIFTAQDESEMYGEVWEELSRLGADDLVIKGMNVADSLVRKAGALLGADVDDEGVIR